MKLHLKEFDTQEFYYIVVDEAHHGQASTFKKVITYFMPQFLLGMTATPKRLDGLNISEIFGDVIYEKDLPQAIKEHLLATVDYRLLMKKTIAEEVEVLISTSQLSNSANHRWIS